MKTKIVTTEKLPLSTVPTKILFMHLASRLDEGYSNHVITLNPEIFMAAKKNKEYLTIIREADTITCDGIGIQLAALIHNRVRLNRVTGVDLLYFSIHQSAIPLMFVGATDYSRERAEKYATELGARLHPGQSLQCNTDSELLSWAKSIANLILEPTIIFVALGAPKQDVLIKYLLPLCHYPVVAIGCGGAIDYLSGQTILPPLLVRQLGLEWIYRLIKQPSRYTRMKTALPQFILHELLKLR